MSIYQQNDDGTWTPAEEIPFYPGIFGKFISWIKKIFNMTN